MIISLLLLLFAITPQIITDFGNFSVEATELLEYSPFCVQTHRLSFPSTNIDSLEKAILFKYFFVKEFFAKFHSFFDMFWC